MSIIWLGESDEWKPLRRDAGEFLMPLVEESVLDAAQSLFDGRRLSLTAAVNCTSRLALRVALSTTDLNPAWQPFVWQPGVVKAPASCLNLGVRFLPENEYIDRLRGAAPALAGCGVVESLITGEAWELDGWIKRGRIGFFHPLRQEWNDGGDKILGYRRDAPHSGLFEAVQIAVAAAGLNDSAFCAEMRRSADGWKLIELNARLGEDAGLAQLMSDTDPLAVIENA